MRWDDPTFGAVYFEKSHGGGTIPPGNILIKIPVTLPLQKPASHACRRARKKKLSAATGGVGRCASKTTGVRRRGAACDLMATSGGTGLHPAAMFVGDVQPCRGGAEEEVRGPASGGRVRELWDRPCCGGGGVGLLAVGLAGEGGVARRLTGLAGERAAGWERRDKDRGRKTNAKFISHLVKSVFLSREFLSHSIRLSCHP